MTTAITTSDLPAQDPWAPDTQIGDVQFNMPNGWIRRDTPGGTIIVPGDLGAGSTAFIDFLPPEQLQGDLRTWFAAKWEEWQLQFRVVDVGATPKPRRTAQGLEMLRIYSRISSPSLGFCAFVFGAVHVGTLVEAYYFVSNANRWSYLNDLETLEQSMQFGTAPVAVQGRHGTQPRVGSMVDSGAPAGIQGLYITYRMRGATQFESTHFEYMAFLPDRNVIRMLPFEGLERFDFAAAVRMSRAYCGRYTVDGDGRLTIHWGDNSFETASRSSAGLNIDGDSYFPVSSSDGLVLNGIYRREGEDLARYGIRFTPDGHFEENGVLPLIAYALTEDKHISRTSGSGTYRIAKNTLTLSYNDGRTIALSFFIWPAEAGSQPKAVHIETFRMVRDR